MTRRATKPKPSSYEGKSEGQNSIKTFLLQSSHDNRISFSSQLDGGRNYFIKQVWRALPSRGFGTESSSRHPEGPRVRGVVARRNP